MFNIDVIIVVLVCLVVLGIGVYLYLEHKPSASSMYTDCIHANSTEFLAVYISCPKEIDEFVHAGGWEINTFGDNKVYMTKRAN